jgi:hypothetical protein
MSVHQTVSKSISRVARQQTMIIVPLPPGPNKYPWYAVIRGEGGGNTLHFQLFMQHDEQCI